MTMHDVSQKSLELGISGIAAYIPPYRVWLKDWCEWTNSSWPKISSVVGRSFRVRGPAQSIYTLAATSVLRLIDQYKIDPSRIGFLGFGTESSTDNSAGAVIIKGMVDQALIARGSKPLARHCEVPEFKHACLGGVYAMKGGLRYLALDGAGSQAIVVSADIAEYARGSSGEATQGAGAVAMLLEADPTLAAVDLHRAGSASSYRVLDFRKPMVRFCGQNAQSSDQLRDFPLFNGKYSTTCYIDETLHALNDMFRRQKTLAIDYMRKITRVFMHRPYQRMPETGWAVAYLFALAAGHDADRQELKSYADAAGVDWEALRAEMDSQPDVAELATLEGVHSEVYPLTMQVLRGFRQTPAYRTEVLDKLGLGSNLVCDLGNLYTASLPAWLAAGFEQALSENLDLRGEEILTLGYGSGDAAECIPLRVSSGWREAAQKIKLAEALDGAEDLSAEQYHCLHEGVDVPGLSHRPNDEFYIERVGRETGRHFEDYGIEYYAYAAGKQA